MLGQKLLAQAYILGNDEGCLTQGAPSPVRQVIEIARRRADDVQYAHCQAHKNSRRLRTRQARRSDSR
jgi:hypothetical protein